MNIKQRSIGFTLIEVIIALAIAGSSLILLLTANQESLRRSMRSRERASVEMLAESKLAEIRCGAEQASSGVFEGQPNLRWLVSTSDAEIEDIDHLERLTLTVEDGSDVVKSLTMLRYHKKVLSK